METQQIEASSVNMDEPTIEQLMELDFSTMIEDFSSMEVNIDENDGPSNDNFDEIVYSYENLVFADVQGFKSHYNRFICKEFCLVSGNDIYHNVIKSPYTFEKLSPYYRKQARWLTKHLHGFRFDSGGIHMIEVLENTYTKLLGKTVVVKGDEKVDWLKYIWAN